MQQFRNHFLKRAMERLKQQCVQLHNVDVSRLEHCSELQCITFLNGKQASELLTRNLSCASVFSTFDHTERDMSDKPTSQYVAFYASHWFAFTAKGCKV